MVTRVVCSFNQEDAEAAIDKLLEDDNRLVIDIPLIMPPKSDATRSLYKGICIMKWTNVLGTTMYHTAYEIVDEQD